MFNIMNREWPGEAKSVVKSVCTFYCLAGEADKAQHVGAGHRTGPGPDGINLAGVHGHATSRNDVAKKEDRLSSHLLA